MMNSYQDQVVSLQAQLSKARKALARDMATVIEARDWHRFLRDRFDVLALVDNIESACDQPDFVKQLQAAGDLARKSGSKRGRPRKSPKARKAPDDGAEGATG